MIRSKKLDEKTCEILVEPDDEWTYYILPVDGMATYIIVRNNFDKTEIYDRLYLWRNPKDDVETDICRLIMEQIEPVTKLTRLVLPIKPDRTALYTVLLDVSEGFYVSQTSKIRWDDEYLKDAGYNFLKKSVLRLYLCKDKYYLVCQNQDILEGYIAGLSEGLKICRNL